MIDWLKARAREVSTKAGVVIAAVAAVAPNYAQFDPRIAWAGAVAGVLLMVFREKPDA